MINMARYNSERGRSNFTLLMAVSVVIIVALGVFSAFIFSQLIDRVIFETLVKPSVLAIQHQMRMHLFEQDRFYTPADPMSLHHFGEFLDDIDTIGDIVRVNIFNKDKVLDFSTVQADIGKTLDSHDIDEALQGEVVIEEPSSEDISDESLKNVLEIYIPASTEGGSIQGVVSVYIDETALFTFRERLYLLVVALGILSTLTVVVTIYLGFRQQSVAAKEQARELRAIIEKAPIGIYIINKKGIIETFNPKMAELAGEKNAERAIGLNVFELHAHKTVGFDEFLRKGFSGESFEQDIEHASHTTLEKMWQHYRGVPLFDDTGKHVERLLLIVEDVTMRKQFEQKLEENISMRTKELQEKIGELEQFKELTIGRELKMIELKKIIEAKKEGPGASNA